MKLSKEELQNLSNLLLSVDDNNTHIAFEIMNSQKTFPKELFTETFVVYKLTGNLTIKDYASDILYKQATQNITKIMTSNTLLGQRGNVTPTEKTIRKNITFYVDISNGQLDGEKMALALYNKYGVGLNYLLKNLSESLKVRLLKSFITGTSFKLTNCSLSKIPDELYAFTDLTEIDLSHNKIKTIPAKIKVFQKLESLNVSKNQINKLNKALASIPNLKRLNISSNKFKEFPPILSELKNLEELNIHELHYTMPGEVYKVPHAFTRLKSLKKITSSDYYYHLGNHVNIALADFPNFTTISATGDTALDLTPLKLAEFAYENNGHSEGVFYLFKYSSDRTLISRIIEEQYYNAKEKLFDLKHSMLDDLPPEIANYDIKHLNFKQSRLGAKYYDVGIYSRYYEVPLKTQEELNQLFKVFENFSNIQSVDLSSNVLTSIPTVIFQWSDLKKLDLRDNKLEQIPENLDAWSNLEYLDLYQNKLTKLTKSFKSLQHLKTLILGENPLEKVPDEIGYLENLEELHFRNPHMNLPTDKAGDNIPESFQFLKNLKRINFYVNGMYYDKDGCKAAYKKRLEELLPSGCEITME